MADDLQGNLQNYKLQLQQVSKDNALILSLACKKYVDNGCSRIVKECLV
jgi:hypothetical protein